MKEIVKKLQISQIKKIHFIDFDEGDFKEALVSQKNPAFIDALKKGIILFGQEKFIKFVRDKLKKRYIE